MTVHNPPPPPSTPSSPRRLIGVSQVAQRLDLSEETVRQRAAAGSLPGFKIGKLWKFWSDQIDQYIADQQALFDSD